MADERHKLQPDPAEGDRETVEHELRRQHQREKKEDRPRGGEENAEGDERRKAGRAPQETRDGGAR